MKGTSLIPGEGKLEKLKELLPEAFTEGSIDWEKLQAALGRDINFSNERYVLNWAGKSDAFRMMQAPTTKTLVPVREESIDFDETDNIFIEGENLETLKALQKSYFNKVKMIYIDPPYNTGNDSFIYPDKFSESKPEYQKRVGDKDEEGNLTRDGLFRKNSRESGQFHSNWLNMMYPRLYLARNLLRPDGVIFVSIDDHEGHNLRLIMDEIFGEENFLAKFIWKRRASSALAEKYVSTDHEYVLAYQKLLFPSFKGMGKDYTAYKNPDNDPRGDWTLGDLTVGMTSTQRPNQYYELTDPETGKAYKANPDRVWAYAPESMDKLIKEKRVYFPENTDKRPMLKRFKSELKSDSNPISTLLDVGMNSEATRELRNVFGSTIFSYSKPISLLSSLIEQITSDSDIIMDFFAGSCTTAHAVLELNRKDKANRRFIMVQMPELCPEKSEAFKAGYRTIADIGKDRIRRVIHKIRQKNNKAEKDKKLLRFVSKNEQGPQDPGFRVFRLEQSNFKQWQGLKTNERAEIKTLLDFIVDPVKDSANLESMVYEILLKSGKDLSSPLDREDGFIRVNRNEMILVLEKVSQEILDRIIEIKPGKVIALDRLFKGNDQLKTNTVLQMRDEGIEFKTI